MITNPLELESTKLEKYLVKNHPLKESFIDELRRLDVDGLKNRLLQLSIHRQEITNTKTNDQALTDVNEKKKELSAPYNEQTRMNAKITRFVHLLMKDRE